MTAADVQEEARLEALDDLGVLDTPAEERFDRITRLATRLLGVDMAAVNLVARDRQWTKAVTGVDFVEMPREDSFCTVAVELGRALVVEDAREDPRFAENPIVVGGPQVRFYAGQPLRAPGGELVGALCVLDEQPHTPTDDELALLRELAGWVEQELAHDEELERAAEVQRGLLPRTGPELPGYDLAGRCVPSRKVGGDLYDWYSVGDGLALTVADVMGKGMAAAIMGASLRAVLRTATRAGDLATAVELASESMQADFAEAAAFATLFLAHLEPATGRVRYVDAGHGLAYLVQAGGGVERPAARGLPAGVLPGVVWPAADLQLEPGDTLVVASDGLLDLHDDAAAVERELCEAVRTCPSAEQVAERLTRPAPGRRTEDDLTVLVLRRAAAS